MYFLPCSSSFRSKSLLTRLRGIAFLSLGAFDGGHDGVRHLGRAERMKAPPQVHGTKPVVEHLLHRILDGRRLRIEVEAVAKQHRGAENGAERVGDALACDVGCRPVNRLVDAERALAERSARQAGRASPSVPRPRRTGCRQTCCRSR